MGYTLCVGKMCMTYLLNGTAKSDDFDLPSGKRHWPFRKLVIFLDVRQSVMGNVLGNISVLSQGLPLREVWPHQ